MSGDRRFADKALRDNGDLVMAAATRRPNMADMFTALVDYFKHFRVERQKAFT